MVETTIKDINNICLSLLDFKSTNKSRSTLKFSRIIKQFKNRVTDRKNLSKMTENNNKYNETINLYTY